MATKRVETTITGGPLSITLQEGSVIENTGLLLSLNGWDEVTNVQVETAPKLFGSGSYVRSARLGERALTMEALVSPDHTVSAGAFLNGLREAAEGLNMINISRAYIVNGELEKTESLNGFITALDSVSLYLDGSARVSLSVLCPNPKKTVSIPEPVAPEGVDSVGV